MTVKQPRVLKTRAFFAGALAPGFVTLGFVTLGLLTLSVAGCSKPQQRPTEASPQNSPSTSHSQTAAGMGSSNDGQITADIQNRIGGDAALSGMQISVNVAGGIATLAGTVNSQAAREVAANDAAQASGVRTVVNNLFVQAPPPVPPPAVAGKRRQSAPPPPVAAAPAPEPAPTPAPPPPPEAPAPPEQVQVVPPQPPPAPPAPRYVTVPNGTVLPVRIVEPLNSGKSQVGDVFHATVETNIYQQGEIAIPRGAGVLGRVVDAKDAAHYAGSSLLSLELTSITVAGKPQSILTDAYAQDGKGRGSNTAKKVGGGALAGAILGSIIGGGKGAAIGSVAGAGAGAGANTVTRGQQVDFPAETIINFRLASELSLTLPPRKQGGEAAPPAQPAKPDAPQLERRQ